MNQDLYIRAKQSIINSDEKSAMKIIDEAVENKEDLMELLLNGFSLGNDEIGKSYDNGSLSLPELIYAAEVMRNVTNTIIEIYTKDKKEIPYEVNRGKILLATVEGDIHDIGKAIVASTLRAAGFEVFDIGCEVSVDTILKEADKYEVDIIATSALLTTTMVEQKKLEKLLSEADKKGRYVTMVGGAPVTERWARKIGADAYSENALEAVETAIELMKKKKENEK